MTSDNKIEELYVWIYLPEEVDPVVAGRIYRVGETYAFNYGKSYLRNEKAIPISPFELPLKEGEQLPGAGLTIHGCLRDALPDAWGRRVILNKLYGLNSRNMDTIELSELQYGILSNSDRIGALDFQKSPKKYSGRFEDNASLKDLLEFADKVDKNLPVPEALERAIIHGSAVGGARPKAFINDLESKWIAKFSSTTDQYSVVKAEYFTMRMAKKAGINVANILLKSVYGRDVILVERFDRVSALDSWKRRSMISALSLFELDEMMSRYASYGDLAEIIRKEFADHEDQLIELYKRMLFNVLCGNTDDHPRNHSAFWDGDKLELTPAYDICPQGRAGNEASQSMAITPNSSSSQVSNCLDAASRFGLTLQEAKAIAEDMVSIIKTSWDDLCEESKLGVTDSEMLKRRQFLNPYTMDSIKGW